MTSTGDPDFDTLFALVGRVASSYANLDYILRDTLAELLGDNRRARAVAEDLSAEQVIGALRRALRADPGEGLLLDYANWVLKAASRAGKERADVAHSTWYLVEHGSEPWTAQAVPAKKRDVKHRAYTVDDLLRLERGFDETAVVVSSLRWLADRPEQLRAHLELPAAERSAGRILAAGLAARRFSPPLADPTPAEGDS